MLPARRGGVSGAEASCGSTAAFLQQTEMHSQTCYGKQPENTHNDQMVPFPQLAAHKTQVVSGAGEIYRKCFHPACYRLKNILERK